MSKKKKKIINTLIESVIDNVAEQKKYSDEFLDAQFESLKKRNKHLEGLKINIIKIEPPCQEQKERL